MRINRFLSQANVGSRRKSEEYILSGRVSVNGVVVDSLSLQVDPDSDEVKLDGVLLENNTQEEKKILALFKPSGYLTSHSDRFHSQTVFQLIPAQYSGYKFAGRLDLESRGLLLFSNSGDWIQEITHPRTGPEKEYKVEVFQALDAAVVEKNFRIGIRDAGETLRAVSVHPAKGMSKVFTVVLFEGKKRQLRRMFAKMGGRVKDLIRVRIGDCRLEDLKLQEGEYCEIFPEDIKQNKSLEKSKKG